MNIPEARRKLCSFADDLRTINNPKAKAIAKKIDIIVLDALWRRKPRRRAGVPIRSKRMTPELKREIRAYVKKHPKQDQQEVGNHFGVNPGRISEVMQGHRK